VRGGTWTLLIGHDDAHHMTWCRIQRLCRINIKMHGFDIRCMTSSHA
jgi:hypothetical protein